MVLHLVWMVLDYFWSSQRRLTLTPPESIFKETQCSYWFTSNHHSKCIHDWKSMELNVEIFCFWPPDSTHCSWLSRFVGGPNPWHIWISFARRGIDFFLQITKYWLLNRRETHRKCARHTTRMFWKRVNVVIAVYSTASVWRLIWPSNGLLFLWKIRYDNF